MAAAPARARTVEPHESAREPVGWPLDRTRRCPSRPPPRPAFPSVERLLAEPRAAVQQVMGASPTDLIRALTLETMAVMLAGGAVALVCLPAARLILRGSLQGAAPLSESLGLAMVLSVGAAGTCCAYLPARRAGRLALAPDARPATRTKRSGGRIRGLKHTLTRIYVIRYVQPVQLAFDIIAEPNRRAILSLLVSSEQSVGEIERQLHLPQTTVSKHLRVLREAGFVESTVDAQRRLYRLKPEPLQEVEAWLAPFRRSWSAHLDALERHLDRMDHSPATKGQTMTGKTLTKSAKAARKPAARAVRAKAAAPRKTARRSPSRAGVPPALLAGGNPQIAKAEGDAPVQAYIAAMPGWKRDLGRRLDALIARAVPGVRKAVKWNSPFYGVEGRGWFLDFHCFTNYVKVAFFRGTSLRPVPPGASKVKEVRYLDIHEGDRLDEAQFAAWVKQASQLPG